MDNIVGLWLPMFVAILILFYSIYSYITSNNQVCISNYFIGFLYYLFIYASLIKTFIIFFIFLEREVQNINSNEKSEIPQKGGQNKNAIKCQ